MKKKILSFALLYFVAVEALFPAHAFAMEGEQEVADIYEWDDGSDDGQSEEQTAETVTEESAIQTVEAQAPSEEPAFDTGATAAGAADTAVSDVDRATDQKRYRSGSAETYTVKLIVDDEVAKEGGFSAYTRTGEDEYSAVYDVNDTAMLPDAVSKPGYRFAGWYDSDTGRFHEGTFQSYGKKTLSAVFYPYVITVKYVKNAPSGSVIGGTVPSTRTYAYNPEDPPAPTDYCFAGTEMGSTHEFTGWYATKDCTGTPVTKLFSGVPDSDTTITLYAGWRSRTYTVSTLQWGTGNSVKATVTGGIRCGEKLSTSKILPEEKAGMTFAGWYALENSGAWTKVGSISAKNRRDITLYAKYNAEYSIVLHDTATGDTYTEGLSGLSAFDNTTLPKVSTLGWGKDSRFVGWSTAKDSVFVKYGNGKKVSFKSDPEGYADMLGAGRVLDLYTVYEDSGTSSRRLVFIADGVEVADKKVSMDETFSLSDVSAPEKKGYRFMYWKDMATGKKKTSIKSGDKRPGIRFEAVYKALKISVKYNNNLPASVKGKVKNSSGKYTYGGKYSLRKNSFKAKGYVFSYWAADQAGDHPIAWAGSSFINDDAERYFYDNTVNSERKATLYAIWKPLEFTYSLDDHGNYRFRAVTVTTDEISSGEWTVSPLQLADKQFDGWTRYKTNKKGILVRNSEGYPIAVSDTVLSTPPMENVYLRGNWSRKVDYAEGSISVEDFNAKPDDGVDDREAITNAIAKASQMYKDDGKIHTVSIPAGTFKISIRPNGLGIDLKGWDYDSSIEIHEFHSDHVRIKMDKNTVLMADYSNLGKDVQRFSVFTLEFVDDVTIEGGIIDGNRSDESTEGKENGGHCIDLSGATNITIKDCAIKNAWTDGVYMGASFSIWDGPGQKLFMGDNITLNNCTIENSRRNNISVINADNVNIKGCTIKDANGEQPMCGIDIEPNAVTAKYSSEHGCYLKGGSSTIIPCKNITVEDTKIHALKSGDDYNYFCFNIIQHNDRSIVSAKNVRINNCTFEGDCYIGNGRDVLITNTSITGKYGDPYGGAQWRK